MICWDLDTRQQLCAVNMEPTSKHEVPQTIFHHHDQIFVHMKTGRILQLVMRSDGILEGKGPVEFNAGSDTFMRISTGDGLCLVPAAGSQGIAIEVVRMEDWSNLGPSIQSFIANTGMCMCSQLIRHGSDLLVIAGFDNGSVSIFSREGDEFMEKDNIQLFHEAVLCMTCRVEPSGLVRVVCGGAGKFVKMIIFDTGFMTTGEIVMTELEREGTSSLCMDDEIVVAGGWDTRISVFSTDSLALLTTLSGHSDGISQVQVMHFPRGIQSSIRPSLRYQDVLVSAGRDGILHLWSLPPSIKQQQLVK